MRGFEMKLELFDNLIEVLENKGNYNFDEIKNTFTKQEWDALNVWSISIYTLNKKYGWQIEDAISDQKIIGKKEDILMLKHIRECIRNKPSILKLLIRHAENFEEELKDSSENDLKDLNEMLGI